MKSKKGFQTMEDEKIVELYLLRNEEALGASKVKYGRMLWVFLKRFCGTERIPKSARTTPI